MPEYIQVNLTRGEVTPLLQARADLDHYRGGAARMRNWVPLRFGGVTRMPGSVYYGAAKHADRYARWLGFEFKRDQTYAIEAGHLYFRFWNYLGQVESGGPPTPYEVVTPYVEADLPFLQYRQLGDVLYITCEGYAPRTLTRTSETNWTLALYDPQDGPFLPTNSTTTTLTPSGTTGAITITMSSTTGVNEGDGFYLNDVGRHVRFLPSDGVWRWGKISAVGSTTTATITFQGTALPNTNPSTNWRLGAWSAATGYPATVGIFEDRLGFGGTIYEPLNVWYTVNGDYDNFAVSAPLVDDDALNLRMTGGKLNAVQWLADGRDILVGTEGSLRAVGRNDASGALSQTNSRQRTESAVPCSYVPPILIENMVLMLDIYRTRLLEAGYTQEVDGYMARELSALNEHLISYGIRDWAYQSTPHKVIWGVNDEGTLLAATYDRDQEVFGVSECDLGLGAYVEAILTLPGIDKDGDQIWFIVRREIDGNVVRYVEYLSAFYREGITEQDYPIYAHAAGVYEGVSTNSIAGLDHLEGETVGVWVDGVDAGDFVVTGGEVTFQEELEGELIVFGLRYTSDLQTLRLAISDQQGGLSLGKRVNVSHVLLDLYQSYAVSAGTPSGMTELRPEVAVEEDPYEPAVLRTGSYTINPDDSWENAGVVIVQTNSMHPATVRMLTTVVEVE